MHDPELKEEMEDFYHALRKILRDDRLTIPSKDYDLVLDIMPMGDDVQWSYYYACHKHRCLFWLEPYDGSHMTSELYGFNCPALVSALQSLVSCAVTLLIRYVEHRLEDLYWYVNNILLDWFQGINVVLVGTTGHSFQSFVRVAVFRRKSTMNSWGYWYMAAWVSLWVSAPSCMQSLTSMA
jgi:hypothetical protein